MRMCKFLGAKTTNWLLAIQRNAHSNCVSVITVMSISNGRLRQRCVLHSDYTGVATHILWIPKWIPCQGYCCTLSKTIITQLLSSSRHHFLKTRMIQVASGYSWRQAQAASVCLKSASRSQHGRTVLERSQQWHRCAVLSRPPRVR